MPFLKEILGVILIDNIQGMTHLNEEQSGIDMIRVNLSSAIRTNSKPNLISSHYLKVERRHGEFDSGFHSKHIQGLASDQSRKSWPVLE
jgi:hypothetical protein